MRAPMLLLSLLLFVIPAFNARGQQAERESHKTVADQWEKNYNAGDYEAIFSAFSTAMQEALPLPEAQKFFAAVKGEYKNIVGRELIRYQGGVALYKTRCERGTFALSLTIDTNNKISGLYIKPYTEIEPPKMERTKTSLILPFNGELRLGKSQKLQGAKSGL